MTAPTALKSKPEETLAESSSNVPQMEDHSDDITLDTALAEITPLPAPSESEEQSEMQLDTEDRPLFPPASNTSESTFIFKPESRKVPIPPHRFTPLKNNWTKIYPPLVKHLLLQVRFNPRSRVVELRTSKFTTDPSALQKGEDFCRAFSLGFDVDDAIAMLRIDGMYLQSFEIKDIKTLNGEHLGRAIGRIAGKDGKMKYNIENATKTRIVLADQKIHLLGSYENINMARESIVDLIRGRPLGKVHNNLRIMSSRMRESF
jgi:RNA-binding protein PNO1